MSSCSCGSKLQVAGYDNTSYGVATNKKDAQTNAAIEFCSFLVERGYLSAREAPFVITDQPTESFVSRPPPVATYNHQPPVWKNAANSFLNSNHSVPNTRVPMIPAQSEMFAPPSNAGFTSFKNEPTLQPSAKLIEKPVEVSFMPG